VTTDHERSTSIQLEDNARVLDVASATISIIVGERRRRVSCY